MNFYCSPLPSAIGDILGLETLKTKNGWHVSLDKGWEINDDYAFKGTQSSWCRLNYSNNFSVDTNDLRDFPIHYHDTCVSNVMKHTTSLPCDGKVSWDNHVVSEEWNKDFYPKIFNTNPLTFDQSAQLVFDTLCDSVESFAKTNDKKILIPAQNGVDTLTVRSVFDYLGIKYNMFDLPKNPPAYSRLHTKLKSEIWGFAQVTEIDYSLVVTGFHGDEWMLRNPFYVNMLLSNRGESLVDAFENKPNCYMKAYWDQNYKSKCSVPNDAGIEKIITMMCNDYQIWHINHTYFFSPLKNRKFLDLLNADTGTVIEQVTNAALSRAVIEKCSPDLINKIDAIKNSKDPVWFP